MIRLSRSWLTIPLSLMISTSPIWASEPAKQESPLTNHVQIGASVNTGNSPTQDYTAEYVREYDISFPEHPWGYKFNFGGQLRTADSKQTARNVHVIGEGRYLFSPKTYVYANAGYVFDAFATFDITVNESIGLGQIVVSTPQQKLTVQAGPGGTHQRIAGTPTYQNSLLLHADANYRRKISDTAIYTQTAVVDHSNFNTHYHATSAIQTKVMKDIALQLSFTIDHDTNIPATSSNTKKTDTTTKATLIYNF